MVINSTDEGKVLTVAPEGRLDSTTSGEFHEYLNENFTMDFEKLIIDFADVDFISSKGLRVIVSVFKELNGREMEIINANTAVEEVFRVSGLAKTFNVK